MYYYISYFHNQTDTMKHTKVKDLLSSNTTLQTVNAKGWVRTFRNNQFIALNDGSTLNNK